MNKFLLVLFILFTASQAINVEQLKSDLKELVEKAQNACNT